MEKGQKPTNPAESLTALTSRNSAQACQLHVVLGRPILNCPDKGCLVSLPPRRRGSISPPGHAGASLRRISSELLSLPPLLSPDPGRPTANPAEGQLELGGDQRRREVAWFSRARVRRRRRRAPAASGNMATVPPRVQSPSSFLLS